MKTSLLVLLVLLALSGCASSSWENRISCSLDKKQAYFLSKYWKLAVGSEIAKADAEVACRDR